VDAQPIQPTVRDPAGGLPIACTLDGAGQAERLDQWRRLLARADRRERIDGGVRFQLPATLAGPAAELAAAEQRCCAFFAFTLHLAGGGLELEVRAPAEALPLLTEVFGPARLFRRPRRVSICGHDDAVAAVRDVLPGRPGWRTGRC
jgi:MerR family copper efflux transcriptional regulator